MLWSNEYFFQEDQDNTYMWDNQIFLDINKIVDIDTT